MSADLVIFDCDGVVIDSEMLSCDALIEALASLGIRVERNFVFQHCIGHSFPEVAAKISNLSGQDLPACFAETYRAHLITSFERCLQPMPGVEAMFGTLDVPFCIATGSSTERAERSLAAAGLASLNAPVFSASMVERGKPAPDLFLLAAERMGFPPQHCLVVEDSLPGILAARAAGMAVWRFTGGSHFRMGFGAEDPSIADAEFSRWDEFIALIKRPVPKAADAL